MYVDYMSIELGGIKRTTTKEKVLPKENISVTVLRQVIVVYFISSFSRHIYEPLLGVRSRVKFKGSPAQ